MAADSEEFFYSVSSKPEVCDLYPESMRED